jgi:hypothetical protein
LTADLTRTRKLLAASDFKTLFIEELGWNHHNARLEILIEGLTITLSAVGEKCGMAAFLCAPGADGRIPDHAMRRKIERQLTKRAHEHLIIFIDRKQTTQVWQWVRRERGKPSACREHTYQSGQPGDSLIQKLQALAVSLEEEECLTLTDVTGRARKAFDVERVTKRFYDRFKAEHAAFLKFLEGIPDEEMERWYVSVMLDRLMFIYFIQKKGFLNSDTDYLKNKLAQCRNGLGKDRYYRDFLCPLFFEGFAKREEERSGKANKLLGEVPYLNGGIFMPHQVEQLYGKTIAIPDKAFEKLFEFFDAYHWHLDERPLKADNEINPDVLGYIFEKYINQKQMGAYYTKEDITEYISKNTVIPFLFDKAKEKCRVAFEGGRPVWGLLREDPDRYIYEAVRRGVVTQEGNIISESILPEFVQKGMHDPKDRMFNRDYNLGTARVSDPDGTNLTLPTETWREYVQRRERCLELRRKLVAGEVCDTNDLITYNLDIRQFAQDVIENCEGPELLVAFWKAIESVTVLDPTCGSGAFLFAALNILEPLYEACLERMRFFLGEWGEGGKKSHPNYHKLFTETLRRVEDHPNPRYFIFKSIILNNLYGVDIMEEGVEICKLRLFLKLVAQIEHVEHVEPLPDIDFNIRAGNTLVGFTSLEEVKHASTLESTGQGKLLFGETENILRRIEEDAEVADRAFRKFHEMQTEQGMSPSDFVEAKENLRARLKKLTDELDHFLASEYGISEKKIPNSNKYRDAFEKWLKTHQPFHWFAEFYGITKAGGFDVIIGNPPYVELSDVQNQYQVRQLTLIDTGNLYALCIERFLQLLIAQGRCGVIVPVSFLSTPRMTPLMKMVSVSLSSIHLSNFAVRPGKLFNGVDMNLTIMLAAKIFRHGKSYVYSTKYNRWFEEGRHSLFETINYGPSFFDEKLGSIPKIGNLYEHETFKKIATFPPLSQITAPSAGEIIYYHSGGRYFRKCLREALSNEYKQLQVKKGLSAAIICLLTSSFYYWYWILISDCYHVTKRDVQQLPVPDTLEKDICFKALADKLLDDLMRNATERVRSRASGDQQKEINFKVGRSKGIIDEIDRRLAPHYQLSAEDIDFFINYDIKYRGRDSDE